MKLTELYKLFVLNGGNVVVVDVVDVEVLVVGGCVVGGAAIILARFILVGLTCMLTWKVKSSVTILTLVIF